MKILTAAYKQMIDSYTVVPHEQGGILGEKNGIICAYFHDVSTQSITFATYTPNIERLNTQIKLWTQQNIRFCGIIHSHPLDQKYLSEQDQQYIRSITEAVPKYITKLFFPIIIPGHGIYSYSVYTDQPNFSIHPDKIIIM